MRYLVTGGAGFIGSALVKRLVKDGHEVIVLDDFSRGQMSRLHGVHCDIICGDIRDPKFLDRAMLGVDSVIHLAYLQGTQTFYAEPRQVVDVAMRGMLNVLAGCEKWGVGELLLVSSSEAYQVADPAPTPETVKCVIADTLNPRYSYGAGKLMCEVMANAWQRTGVLDRVMIARPHNIYGPDMGREHVIPEFCLHMNDLIAEHPLRPGVGLPVIPFPIQGSGQETRSFCYIDDAVDQLTMLLGHAPDHGTEIYHVGQEEERSISDLAEIIAAAYEREIKIQPGSLPQGSPTRRLPDTAKIRGLYPGTGRVWQHTTFEVGLERTVNWYRDHA